MNAHEHIAEGEVMVLAARSVIRDASPETIDMALSVAAVSIAAAQVHATLALAILAVAAATREAS